MTKSRKKVILFIVEGSSDEILLRSFKLIFSEEIRFAVIHGDTQETRMIFLNC